MEKIDLRKELKHLYAPSSKTPAIVDVPAFNYIMVDGDVAGGQSPGDSPEFQNAIGALYGVAYTVKFMAKKRPVNPIDHTVMALEGLWWTDTGEFSFEPGNAWHYTLMILQPSHVTKKMIAEALSQLEKKKDNPALSKVRFERLHEGLCVQIMHIGPYSEEPRTIERMLAFARENGYAFHGRHHEIYLGDPRRAKPEKLKTVLRHPLTRAR